VESKVVETSGVTPIDKMTDPFRRLPSGALQRGFTLTGPDDGDRFWLTRRKLDFNILRGVPLEEIAAYLKFPLPERSS
jgi:hypothetical protein